MRPSSDPLQRQDREHSNTLAMSQRCAHKGSHHPFFLHNVALAITSPSPQSVFPSDIPNKGAQVLVTSALSAPGEGHSRLGRKNLPRIRSSEITSTLCTPPFDHKLLFASSYYPLFRQRIPLFPFSVWSVRTGANRDSALHSNFPKQYAAASAEAKKDTAQNHASPLTSCLTQRVANTPLHRATVLDATSNAK